MDKNDETEENPFRKKIYEENILRRKKISNINKRQ